MIKLFLLSAALITFSITTYVAAQTVSFRFIGELTSISVNNINYFQCPDNPLTPCRSGSAGMTVGDHFQGTITYDPATTGIPVYTASGSRYQYLLDGLPNELEVEINSGFLFQVYTIDTVNDATGYVAPIDHVVIDTPYTDFGGFQDVVFSIDFGSFDINALDSNELPTTPLDLDIFEVAQGTFNFVSPDNSQVRDDINFNIISITAIPIPPSVWLFGSGMIGLILIARMQRKAKKG